MDSSSPSRTVIQSIPVLGRTFKLGGLYNVNTAETADNPVPDDTVQTDKAVKRDSTKIFEASDKFLEMNISKPERLEILLGMIPLSGSSEVFQLEDNSAMDSVLLVSRRVTEKRSVEDSYCSDEEGKYTHRIISLVYGVRVVMLLQVPKTKRKLKLIHLVDKLRKIKDVKDKYCLYRLDSKEYELSKLVTCRIFSDIPLKEQDDLTATDVVALYQRLPQIVEAADPVPLFAEISQLGPMQHAELPVDLLDRFTDFLTSLRAFCQACNALLGREITQKFKTIMGKISLYGDIAEAFEADIIPQIRHSIIQYRSGEVDIDHIKKILENIDGSPFHMNVGYQDVLQDWLNQQKQLMESLEKIIVENKRKKKAIVLDATEADAKIVKGEDMYAVFYLGITVEEKEHLINMVEHGSGWVSSQLEEVIRALPVYRGSASSMKKKLRDFITLSLETTANVVFLITEEDVEEVVHGQIRIYKDGEITCDDFVLPCKLDEPTVNEVCHDQITVTLNENDATVDEFEVVVRSFMDAKNKTVKGDAKTVVFDGLQPATIYRVRIRCVTLLGAFPFSPETVVATGPGEAPKAPEGMQISCNGCVIRWPRPGGMLASVVWNRNSGLSWEIEISWLGDQKIEVVSGDSTTHHVHLESDTTYRFRVKVSFKVNYNRKAYISKSNFSAYSEPFELSCSAVQIAKNRSLMSSDVVKNGTPSVHQLKLKQEHVDPVNRLRRLSYGPADSTKPMKTILVVGATGAGKSTLINAFVNYVLGVKFEDNYRFRIIEEHISADQSVSQTKWVTAYVLYHQATFPDELPYSLTIIDTPGFGDTSGIKADQEITDQLSEYFHARGHEGIDTLDAVGFVVQASLPRLTPTQQYIFDSILALFGHDVKDNIFVLVTFADGQKAPVMSALDKAKLPYTRSFKFNNSALFADRSNDAQDSDDDSDEEQSFDKNFWTMGAASYRKFLLNLSRTESKSLVLTNQVLDERKRLETHVSGIQVQIKVGLTKQDNLRAGLDCLQQHQVDIDRNKDFTFDVNTTKIVAIPLPRGTYVTNCLTCNQTCHYPCSYNNDDDKYKCAAMTSTDKNSVCGVCPNGCHWSVHRNTPERLEVQTVTERQTVSQMKSEYENACQQQLSTEDLIMKIIDDVEGEEMQTAYLVEEVRTSLQKLSMIALKPNHMNTVGYIDTLIESEKHQALNGWRMRVRQLEAVRERAETTRKVAEYHGIKEPWKEMRQEIEEKKRRGEKGGVISVVKCWVAKTYLSFFKRQS